MRTLGAILLVLGVTMTVFTGFKFTKREEVANIGSIRINREKQIPIYWSPVAGGVLMAAGVLVLLLSGSSKKL